MKECELIYAKILKSTFQIAALEREWDFIKKSFLL